MSTKGNLRYILRHEQSLKHSDKLNSILDPEHPLTAKTCAHDAESCVDDDLSTIEKSLDSRKLGNSMRLKKEFLEHSFQTNVENNPLFEIVDDLSVFCKCCGKVRYFLFLFPLSIDLLIIVNIYLFMHHFSTLDYLVVKTYDLKVFDCDLLSWINQNLRYIVLLYCS
jgi:hypothetical protein